MEEYKIPANTRIGHVHLKVADLQKSLDFYHGLLGFEIISPFGDQAAFVSAGGYHHHIGLNTWQSKNGPAPAPNATGLFILPSSILVVRIWPLCLSVCRMLSILLRALPIMVFRKLYT